MLGGPLQKIRDDAAEAMVSWDDAQIAFTNSRFTEILIRDLATGRDRRVVSAQPSASIIGIAWSPDNQHLAYVERQRNGRRVSDIHVVDVQTERQRNVIAAPGLTTLAWTRDGRLIYNADEPAPNENSQNLWELPVAADATPQGKARRITDLYGFQFAFLRTTNDGRKLSYVRWRHQSDVMIADVTGPGSIATPKRLTPDERIDWPGSWLDERTVLFYSDRNGAFDLFKQDRDSTSAVPLLVDRSEKRYPQLSPDRQWILYLSWQDQRAEASRTGVASLMRLPISGGVPQRVMDLTGYPGSARVVLDSYFGLTTNGHPRFRCPTKVDMPCVVSELSGREIVFTTFDPVRGRIGVLARVPVDPTTSSFWDLSADGSRLVVGERIESSAPLHIFELAHGRVERQRTIAIRDWNMLHDAVWTPDAAALYLVAFRSTGYRLLYATLDGAATPLHKAFGLENPVAAPDGKSVAFGEVVAESNAWMLER